MSAAASRQQIIHAETNGLQPQGLREVILRLR